MIYQIHQQDAELRGERRGEERNMIKTAKGMLQENLPADMISRVTGLSVSEINKLKAAANAN